MPGGGLLVEWPEEGRRACGPTPLEFETREAATAAAVAASPSAEVVEWVTMFGDGKERQLDAARQAAAWPTATDADLTEPGLEARLQARLPGLMAEFRRDVEALGFTW